MILLVPSLSVPACVLLSATSRWPYCSSISSAYVSTRCCGSAGCLLFFLQSSDRKKCLSPTFINHQRVLLCVHHLYRYMHRSLIDDTEFCADVETLAREVGSPRHADDLRPYQSRSGASKHQGGRVFCATQLAHVPPSRAGSQTGWPTREPGRCTMA